VLLILVVDNAGHQTNKRPECYDILAQAMVPRSVRPQAYADATWCSPDVKTIIAILRPIGPRRLSNFVQVEGNLVFVERR
jgi:hypothetical protein